MIVSSFNDALEACERALDSETETISQWQANCRTIANFLSGMGRFEESAVWQSLALEDKPNLIGIYYHLGSLYNRQQQWEKSISCYEKVIKISPDFLEAYWSLTQVYMVLEKKDSLAEIYYKLGLLYGRQQNWERSIASFEQAITINPGYAEAYGRLAQIFSHIGDIKKESDCWYKALSLKPEQAAAEAHYRLGKALQEQQRSQEAILCFERAIQQDRNYTLAYEELAEVFLQKGYKDKAIACYQTIIAQDPQRAIAYYKLGNLWLQQQKYEEAIDAFKQTIQLDPKFPWSYRELVQTFMRSNKWDEAIATCQGILTFVSEYPWVHSQMGNALIQKGEFTEASLCFQKAGAVRGWNLCLERGYQFTQDYFTFKIPVWQEQLASVVNTKIHVLEIGSFQGMTACWLLDNVLLDPRAKLTCLDLQYAEQFDVNIAKTKSASKVTKLEGDIHQLIESLPLNAFELINLQDRRKQPALLQKTAQLAWNRLKLQGLMIFNDYGWVNPANPEINPTIGIKAFIDSINGKFKVIYRSDRVYQFLIQKIAP
jgi:tetratricopeptide (TPR) repeat protein